VRLLLWRQLIPIPQARRNLVVKRRKLIIALLAALLTAATLLTVALSFAALSLAAAYLLDKLEWFGSWRLHAVEDRARKGELVEQPAWQDGHRRKRIGHGQ
jgi:hypothetical protein